LLCFLFLIIGFIVAFRLATFAAERESFKVIECVRAAGSGQTDRVRQCLDAGMNVNGQDELGETSLYSAARHAQIEVVDYLLQRDASVAIQTELGRTALMDAGQITDIETPD